MGILTMGIDVGTTSISMVMLDEKTGEMAAQRTINHQSFLKGSRPEEKIQDPEMLLRVVSENLQDLISQNGEPCCIGLTGQMHGMLYVNDSGSAVSPLYIWQDQCGNLPLDDGRSASEILRERVGNAAAGYGITTHFYLQKAGKIPPDANYMTTISDYIAMRLCGLQRPVLGADMAASWGCFDMERRSFLEEKLKAVGVDTSCLPEVLKTHEIVGHYKGRIPVMCSLGDNQASVLGAVRELSDTLLLNVGTGSQVSLAVRDYIPCQGSLELRPCTDDMYMMVGSSLCGGRAYAMLEQFYREAGTDPGLSCYDRMGEQAEDFVNRFGLDAAWKVRTTFSGTRDNPDERGSISGIGVENFHPGALTAGVIAGILEELYEMYQEMVRRGGRKAVRLVGSGNGIRKNRLMRRMAEERFGLKLEIPVYKEEAACGAALMALVASKRAQSLGDVQALIRYE